MSWAGPADGVVVVGPATQAWGRADQEPNHFPRRHLSPLGLLGCLHGSQLLSKKWKVKEEFKWSEGAHGGGEDGHSDALNVSLESVAGSLPAEPHPQREAAWLGLVLSGAHWLWMCNLLAWGHRALGG